MMMNRMNALIWQNARSKRKILRYPKSIFIGITLLLVHINSHRVKVSRTLSETRGPMFAQLQLSV